jgi:hypothetical protein
MAEVADVPSSEARKSDIPNLDDGAEELVLPSGWMYRQFEIGSLKLPWYASPPAQLLVVAIVCFMCPGMFNALNGMGGVSYLIFQPLEMILTLNLGWPA